MTESTTTSAAAQRLEQLEAEATHARERYDLYRAKTYGSRATSPTQLRKLQEASKYAEARLKRARDAA